MTWPNAVKINAWRHNGPMDWDHLDQRRKWCMANLSSNGVLWKHDSDDWNTIYFAQEQDAIMFRLLFP